MFIFGLIWNALIACNSFPILLAAKRCKYLNIKHDHINWTISILSIALLLYYSVFSKFTKPQRQNHANNYNKLKRGVLYSNNDPDVQLWRWCNLGLQVYFQPGLLYKSTQRVEVPDTRRCIQYITGIILFHAQPPLMAMQPADKSSLSALAAHSILPLSGDFNGFYILKPRCSRDGAVYGLFLPSRVKC